MSSGPSRVPAGNDDSNRCNSAGTRLTSSPNRSMIKRVAGPARVTGDAASNPSSQMLRPLALAGASTLLTTPPAPLTASLSFLGTGLLRDPDVTGLSQTTSTCDVGFGSAR